ncbi:MAG: chemotaxis protein CheW [Pseudomonadales bacterium]|nr:chemotaxis protein CheW [Pseudomonadales bacterium]
MSAVDIEPNVDEEITSAGVETDQYLTFIMDNEEYGVDILSVKEIRIWDSATPIPKAPSHVRGVINLRGTIVPIIDLRQCFGMSAIDYGPLTVVLVLQVETEKGHREVGIVVDAVSDTADLDRSQVKPAPDMGDKINTSYIKGLATIDKKMVILLNMGNLLNQEDFSAMAEAQKSILELADETTE